MTYKNILKGGMLAVLVVGGGFAGALIERHQFAPELVTVDIESIVRTRIAKTVESDLSDSEKTKAVTEFGRNLNALMGTLAKKQHLIILPSQAVVAGTRDITDDIKKGMAQ